MKSIALLKSTFKDSLNSLGIFYGIIFVISMFIVALDFSASDIKMSGGSQMYLLFFSASMSCTLFNTGQNVGISRKTIFKAGMMSSLIITAVLCIFDGIFNITQLVSIQSMFGQTKIYMMFFEYLAFAVGGMMGGIIWYKLSKIGKIVAIAFIISIFTLFPMLFGVLYINNSTIINSIIQFCNDVLKFFMNSNINIIYGNLILMFIYSIIYYFVLRKAQYKL